MEAGHAVLLHNLLRDSRHNAFLPGKVGGLLAFQLIFRTDFRQHFLFRLLFGAVRLLHDIFLALLIGVHGLVLLIKGKRTAGREQVLAFFGRHAHIALQNDFQVVHSIALIIHLPAVLFRNAVGNLLEERARLELRFQQDGKIHR